MGKGTGYHTRSTARAFLGIDQQIALTGLYSERIVLNKELVDYNSAKNGTYAH
jgi:hypothetical protein